MDVANALERYMLGLVNAERTARGLDPLQLEQNLNTSADHHSQWMTDTDTFSHTGAGGSTHTARIQNADFNLLGSWRTAENIAAVSVAGGGTDLASLYDEVDRLHTNLMNSPTHRANILDPNVDYLGIGIVVGPMTYSSGNRVQSVIVTQNFAATSRGVVDLDLAGGSAADVLTGGAGDDHLQGFGGTDRLVTGNGDDTVLAGAGDDRIEVGRGIGIKQIDGGVGTDRVALSMTQDAAQFALHDGLLRVDTAYGQLSLTGVEWLEFDDGAVSVASLIDGLNGASGGASDGASGGAQTGGQTGGPTEEPSVPSAPLRTVRTGGTGDDLLAGTAGADLMMGAGGSDTLTGDAGRDVLVAEACGLFGTDESAQVYRLFDTVLGRAPAITGHQHFTAQIASGALTLGDLAAGLVASAEFQQVYGPTSNAEFVTLLYQNVFGRAPAQSGLEAWTGVLDGGRARADVVRDFSETAEHVLRTAGGLGSFEDARDQAQWSDDVYRLFGAVFDRAPGAAGFSDWTAALAGGADLDAVVRGFVASPEFQLRYGNTTDAEFVTLLFQNVLDRDPAQAGLDAWTGLLAGGMTREQAVRAFMDTPEYVAKTGPELVSFMRGLGQDDVLEAGAGDSVLSGGMYSDAFVFGAGDDGTHQITDIEAWDVISLSGFGYADAAEALDYFAQVGDDVVFEDQGVRIVLSDWNIGQVTPEMIDVA